MLGPGRLPMRHEYAARALASVAALSGTFENGTVTVVSTSIDVWDEAELVAQLGRTESERAQRYVHERDRKMSGAAALLSRAVVERWVGAQRIQIGHDCWRCGPDADHGRPVVSTHPELQLSITHSDGLVGVAVTRGGRLGIDVERTDIDVAHLAPRVFSTHELSRPIGPAAVLGAWTMKESLLKLTGAGLTCDPRSIVISGDPPQLIAWPQHAELVGNVGLTCFTRLDAHWAVAVARRQRPVRIEWHQLSSDARTTHSVRMTQP